MPETTPLIKAALNLRGGAGFDVYFVMENGQNYSQNCLCNINKFLSVYNLVKVAAWQSSNIGCFFVAYF